MARLIIAFMMLSCFGCQAYRYIGMTPLEDHNKHVMEAEQWAKDAGVNQGRIVDITDRLNAENAIEARSSNDMAKLERVLETQGVIDTAQEVSEELTSRKWAKIPEPPFDWSTLIPALIGLATGTTTVGAVAFKMRGTIKTLATQAIQNGESTEKDDTSHLRRYV